MKKILAYILAVVLIMSIVPFSVFAQGTVSSISYSTDYTELVENADGEWDYHDNYFRYYCNFHEGDQLTVYYTTGAPKVFVAEFMNGELYFTADGETPILQWVDIFTSSNQNESHWTVGGSYNYYVEYSGCRTAVTVNIVTNPVAAIEYIPYREHILYENSEGYFRDDGSGTGSGYFYYNCQRRDSGDKLIVIGLDSSRKEYTFTFDDITREWCYISEDNDVISDRDVNTFDNQEEKHFTLGSDNSFGVRYMGQVAYIPVTVVKNPITDISYFPVDGQKTVYENSNGEWRTDEHGEPFYEYHAPGFDFGDVLAVTYSDTGETVRYTFREVFYEQSNAIAFFDDNLNQLPEGDLSTRTDGDWFLNSSNSTMIVSYFGISAAPVPVLIVENPVKAIRFERAEPVVLVEDIDVWYDDWDGRYYYNIPYHREGDRLIVTDNNNNETVYDYQVNGVFACEGKEDILSYDVHFGSDQRNNPWGLGEHEYTVEYFGATYTLTATVIENNVKAIEYLQASPFSALERTHGDYDSQYDYFHYWYNWSQDGDKLIVIDKNDVRTEYTYQLTGENDWDRGFVSASGDIIEDWRVTFDDEQYLNHWTVGTDNEYYVEYMGAKFSLYATILENNIVAVRYLPIFDIVTFEGVHAFYSDYINGYIYEVPPFFEGDQLILTDKFGIDKAYTAQRDDHEDLIFIASDGDEIHMSDIEKYSDQWSKPWVVGTDNEFTIRCFGAECTAICTIIENPVDYIEFVPAEITKYLEGTSGYYDEWDDVFYYDLPRVNEGDTLIVHYKDPLRGRVEYVASFDREANCMTFVSGAGEIIYADDNFEYWDDQYANPWELGENHWTIAYCGKETQVPVVIVENNIAGITYTPVSMPQVWETDYSMDRDEQTGEEYKHYNIPDFSDGDILTVYYDDTSSKAYTLTFDETDGERYFVNGNDRFHIYTLVPFDNQNLNEWSLGRGNFYFVDFYGNTARIEVEMIDTDVESITFTPVQEIVIDENKDGEFVYSGEERFYLYTGIRIINIGDTLTVKYKSGEEITYVISEDPMTQAWHLRADSGEELDTQEVTIDDHQWERHWRPGTNYFEIKYHGVSDSVPVTVKGAYMPGDINMDGAVDNKDLIRLFQYLSEWNVEVNTPALDVNGDGGKDNKDLIRLFQYLSEWNVQIY